MFLKGISKFRTMSMKGIFTRWYSHSQKVANLGLITDYLVDRGVPNLLQEMFKESVLAENIVFRLFPTSHPYIPALHGKAKYKASLNAIRMIVRKFILSEECRLHISSVKTLLSESYGRETKTSLPNYNTITCNDKIVIKWQSCIPEDHCKIFKLEINDRLKEKKQGSGGNSTFSMRSVPVIDYILHPTVNNINHSDISEYIECAMEKSAQKKTNKTDEDGKSDGASKKSKKKKLSRLIRGTFIFEFNEENSRILVHTIEDVELIHYEKRITTRGAFAC